MACPESVSFRDISGCYTINKALSDDPEAAMNIRGVAWPIRKAMKVAPPLCITIKHSPASSPPTWTFGFPRTGPMGAHDEIEHLDYEWNEKKNPVIGMLKSRVKPMEYQDLKDDYLREGWSESDIMYVAEVNEKDGWEAHNVWGFSIIDGERHYCRKTFIKGKKGETNYSRVVHDFKPLP